MAKMRGVTAIATTRSQAKKQALLDIGADHVIVTNDEDAVARVMEITKGRGVELVYDGVGGDLFERLGDVVAERGWYILYGVSGGFDLKFPVLSAFRKSWRFHVYKVSEFTGSQSMNLPRDAAALNRDLALLDEGFTSGALRVRIDRTFRFDEVVEAHRALEQAAHVGKLVLTV